MEVQVRLFAAFRDAAGSEFMTVHVGEGACVADLISTMNADGPLAGALAPGTFIVAIDHEYARDEAPIPNGSEVALIPPISGGSGRAVPACRRATLGPEPVDIAELDALVRHPAAGAVVTFLGTTRDVAALEYEAYEEMAPRVLEGLVSGVASRFGLTAVAVHHRTGTVDLMGASVGIAVSAPHRPQAFDGAREIIDQIKQLLPVWKVEIGVDGSQSRVRGTVPHAR